ncbi:MAG TPA: methyltransferase [Bacteroidales bacterium]|nr:methyltransferase [Bacteroidales bacterium]HPT01774.1 methyltransferase [Bacteroidales bacterium]
MFRFKQFCLSDENATMKTGTDAVLLGSWAGVTGCRRILDIGTGSGIIALMLAQRCEAMVDAIEIDEASALQAENNVHQSPWPDRIKVHHTSFQAFAASTTERYDAVISNPPFFSRALKAPDPVRCRARHDDELPAGELIRDAVKILLTGGKIHLVVPFRDLKKWETEASFQQLYCINVTHVIPKEGKPPFRALVTFSGKPGSLIKESLVIHNSDGSYTDDYRNLTKDFYLAF